MDNIKSKPIKNKATVSHSKGTEYLSVIYRHPVVKDNNKPTVGKRVRKSLVTKDIDEANSLAKQLTEILRNPKWHNISMKHELAKEYGELLCYIFYSPMDKYEPTEIDSIISDLEALKYTRLDKIHDKIDSIVLKLKDIEMNLNKR